jgi:hypothetical protein
MFIYSKLAVVSAAYDNYEMGIKTNTVLAVDGLPAYLLEENTKKRYPDVFSLYKDGKCEQLPAMGPVRDEVDAFVKTAPTKINFATSGYDHAHPLAETDETWLLADTSSKNNTVFKGATPVYSTLDNGQIIIWSQYFYDQLMRKAA